MNITQARKTLNFYVSHLTESKEPLENQITRLFVPSLFGRGLVLRTSLSGKIANLFNHKNLDTRNQKVKQTFANTLAEINRHQNVYTGISFPLRVSLDRFMRKEKPKVASQFLSDKLSSAPETENLQNIHKQHLTYSQKETFKRSLLRQDNTSLESIDTQTFETLFDISQEDTKTFLDRLKLFLEKHPELASVQKNRYLAQLKKAQEFNEKLQTTFLSSQEIMVNTSYQTEKRKTIAKEMVKIVEELPAKQSWLFCGSYGRKETPFQALFNLFKLVPPNSLATLPEPLQNLLSSPSLPQPEKVSEEIVHQLIEALTKNMPGLEEVLKDSPITSLMHDETRKLPKALSRILPSFIEKHLNGWLKNGLIGNIGRFINDESLREFILMATDKAVLMKGSPRRKELIGEIEKRLILSVTEPIASAEKNLNSEIHTSFLKAHKTLPENFQNLFGTESLATKPLWFEFEKQENGKYTVLVYASGKALENHPHRDKTQQTQWPLRITNVKAEKLNSSFFDRLLFHKIAPQCDENVISDIEDIYKGVIRYLEGDQNSSEEQDWRQISKKDFSESHLTQSLLTNSKIPSSIVSFEFHKEALLSFCNPYLIGPNKTLTLNTLAECNALDAASERLTDDLESVKLMITKKAYQEVQATLKEIHEAIEKTREQLKPIEIPASENPLNLPASFISPLKKFMNEQGISLKHLEAARSVLSWALGDEIGELIDAFRKTLGSPTVQGISPALAPSSKEKGWLSKILFNHYFNALIVALEAALLLTPFFQLGVFLLGITAVKALLKQVIPAFIQQWFANISQSIQQKILEITGKIVLRCLFSKDANKLLEEMFKECKKGAQDTAKSLLGTQQIQYTLKEPIKASNSKSAPRTSSEKSKTSKNYFEKFTTTNFSELKELHNLPLSSKNIVYTIKHLITESTKMGIFEGNLEIPLLHLQQQILNLEIPSRDSLSYWDTIEKPEACMELVSDLALHLSYWTEKNRSNLESAGTWHGNSIIARYTLLAIMDRLARRCPNTHLDGYEIDAYPLLRWARDPEAQLTCPIYLAQFHKVCAYFMPAADLSKNERYLKHTDDPYKDIAPKTLFYSPEDNGSRYLVFGHYSLRDLGEAERRYYLERLKDPNFASKVQAELEKNNEAPPSKEKITEYSKLKYVLSESLAFSSQNPLLSRQYSLLKIHTEMCSTLSSKFFSYDTQSTHLLETLISHFVEQSPTILSKLPESLQKRAEGLFGAIEKIRYDDTNSVKIGSNDYVHRILSYSNPSTQVGLITKSQKKWKKVPKWDENSAIQERQLQEMIRVESSDQIIRVLAYFKEHKDKLSSSLKSDTLALLETLLFRAGDLEKQIKTSPKIVEAIGETFNEFLDYFEKMPPISNYCRLVEIGLKLKRYCDYFAPDKTHAFPDFESRLKAMINKYDNNSKTKLWLMCLHARALDQQDPLTLSDAKQKEVIKTLVSTHFFINYTTPRMTKEGIARNPLREIEETKKPYIQAFEAVYWKWLPIFDQHTRNGSFTKELLQIAITAANAPSDIDELDLTSAIFPNYYPENRNPTLKPENKKNEVKSSLQPVDSQLFDNSLSPLSRFCPLSKMICQGKPGESNLSRISFTPYNLTFDVVKAEEGLQAVNNSLFPGFAIAPLQQDPALNNFSAYLLLKNKNGEKKVIIPDEQWMQSLASRFTSELGVFQNLLNGWASRISQMDESKRFVYDLDKNGQLHSEDPKSLAHLMLVYLLQGQNERALQVCTQLEMLCKRQYISKEVAKLLIPLNLIPGGLPIVSQIRIRLSVAFEENRLLQVKDKERDPTSDILEDSTGSIVTFLDLISAQKETDPLLKLSDDQEWFLFKKLFNHTRQIFQNNFDPPKQIKKIIHSLGWETIISALIFPPGLELSQRYKELKQKYETIESAKSHDAASKAASDNLKESTSKLLYQALDYLKTTMYSPFSPGSLEHLKVDELEKVILKEISEQVPFTIEELTPEALKKYYLSYYAIARGEQGPQKTRQLLQLLALIRGGWDSQTRLLILQLETVANTSSLVFQNSEHLKKILHSPEKPVKAKDKSRLNQLIDFFQNLNDRAFGLAAAKKSIELGLSTASYTASLAGSAISSTISAGVSQLLNPKSQRDDLEFGQSSVAESSQLSYESLANDDQYFDSLFDQFFENAFEESVAKSPQTAALPKFDQDSSDPKKNEKISRIQQSFKDYANREDKQTSLLKLKSREAPWNLYVNLMTCRDEIHGQLEKELQALLKTLNSNRTKNPLTFHDLKRFFLKGNFEDLSSIVEIHAETFVQLELAIARHLVRGTRLQQINRAIRHIEALGQLDPTKQRDEYESKIEQLADELKARRNYNFKDVSVRLLRRFMLFEYTSDKMLWKKQSTCMQNLLSGNFGDAVIELQMSFGKTDVAIPIIDAFEADGKKIVFNVWPSAMAGTNVRHISKQGKQIFDQTTNAVHFNRDIPLTSENFDAFFALLRRSMEKGETINLTKVDAQALRNIFIDKLHQCLHKVGKTSKTEVTALQLKTILRVIRKLGKAIGDEAHELFKDTEELSYPVGDKKTIKPSIFSASEALIKIVAEDPLLKKLIEDNNLSKIAPKKYKEVVAIRLAERMSYYPEFGIQTTEIRNEFISFVCGRSKTIPSWISKSPHYSEISMVKGILTILLPMIFSRTINVDFGASMKPKGGEYALPYEGNSSPLENATIRSPDEALIKTFTMFLHKGLNPRQLEKLILHLYKAAVEKSSGGEIQRTEAYKTFSTLFNADLCEIYENSSAREAFIKAERFNQSAIFFYIREFVWLQIRYWKQNIRCNAQNFASMFSSQIHDTGTPYNDGTYPANLEMLWDPGTIAQALSIIKQKCPEKGGIHLLTKSKPVEVLNEVLEKFFVAGSDFTAIIDGGAQFKGMTNEDVAKQMLEYVRRNRPDIKAIDFFKRDANGNDLLVTWQIGAIEAVAYDQCHLPPSERLAYFDQRHGFAANIPQKFNGKGLHLPGKKHTLSKLLQEVFRMRGIKIFKKLLGIGDETSTEDELQQKNLTNTQTINFALTPEVRQAIYGDSEPTLDLDKIYNFAIANEAEACAVQNYHAYTQKTMNVIQTAVFDKILEADSMKEILDIFKEFEKIFVFDVEDDPKKLYGLLDTFIPVQQALEVSRNQAFKLIANSSTFDKAEKEAIKTSLDTIPKPIMPEEIHVYTDGKTFKTDTLDNLEKDTNLEVDAEVENETETQHQIEKELQTDVRTQLNNPNFKFKENSWDENLDISSTSWLKLDDVPESNFFDKTLKSLNPFTKKSDEPVVNPPLYRIQDVLKTAKIRALKKIAKAFSSKIWVSNNFLPLNVKLGESPVEVCSSQQRKLFEVLIHLEEKDGQQQIKSIGCLSQRDAAIWRKKLKEQSAKSSHKVVLYDTALRTVVAGDDINLASLRQNKEFNEIELMLKFLDGETSFPKDKLPLLAEWVKKNGVNEMEEAFFAIQTQKENDPALSSEIKNIFIELRKQAQTK